jgi:phosphopentomutase
MFQRVVLIILDACGVGELPDAAEYGDIGAATIPNIAKAVGKLNMPNCRSLGLGNIVPIEGVSPLENPRACFGKMAEVSPGKDSTSGHWEIAGIILKKPFPVYPKGFPPNLVAEFEKKVGIKTVGNIAVSGTEIIKQLGKHHMETGDIILYTSADSVFQLAAHEAIIPLEKLYEICLTAREMLKGEYAVGRVIARPFIGEPGNFNRTAHRRDFSLEPPSDTVLDKMMQKEVATVAIGKIGDLFAHRGLSKTIKTADNNEVMAAITDAIRTSPYGLIFANLVDFDMLWGHRNDTKSFARGLEEFDQFLGCLLPGMKEDDLLIITADHGCDPTLKNSTDHTREYVPLLVYNKNISSGVNLGIRESFSDIGQTLAEIFGLGCSFPGKSFLKEIVESIK